MLPTLRRKRNEYAELVYWWPSARNGLPQLQAPATSAVDWLAAVWRGDQPRTTAHASVSTASSAVSSVQGRMASSGPAETLGGGGNWNQPGAMSTTVPSALAPGWPGFIRVRLVMSESRRSSGPAASARSR